MDKKTFDETMGALEATRKKATVSKETAREYLINAGFMDAVSLVDFIFEPKEEEFTYIIAQLWKPNDPVTWPNLCIYSYGGSDTLYGTKENASGFLKYVEEQKYYDGSSYNKESLTNPWKIYKINFEELT